MSCNDLTFIDTLTKKLHWVKGAELMIWCEKNNLNYRGFSSISQEKYRSIAMDKITYVMLIHLCKNNECLFWETVEELIRQTGNLDDEIVSLLSSKGKKWMNNRLHPIRPLMLNPIKQMDSLEILHTEIGFPGEYIREIREAYNSYAISNDPKGALDRYRTVLEKLLHYIADYAINHHPNASSITINFKKPWSIRNGLKDLDFLPEKEKEMVDAFYGWISSTSTHQWSWLASPFSVEFVMVVFPAWIALFSERFRVYMSKYP